VDEWIDILAVAFGNEVPFSVKLRSTNRGGSIGILKIIYLIYARLETI